MDSAFPAKFIENLPKFDFRWVLIYFYRQKMVWDMPDGCKTPCESIGTCFETIWLYQTLETHFSTSKFQLWVRQLVLKTSLFVQESLRRPFDSWELTIDYRLSIIDYRLLTNIRRCVFQQSLRRQVFEKNHFFNFLQNTKTVKTVFFCDFAYP